MKLPMYMLAITPQKSWGFSTIMLGPGVIPWSISAPTTMAMAGVKGTPSARSGT